MPEIAAITNFEDLERLLQFPRKEPIFLFKHSTSCPVSARAYAEYQSFVADLPKDAPVSCYMLLVLENRGFSTWVSEKLEIKHESPQLLLIIGGEVVWHASHYRLSKETMLRILNAHLKK